MRAEAFDLDFDPEKIRRLLGGTVYEEKNRIDPFNNKLNRRISRSIKEQLPTGIHRIKVDDEEFLIYYKYCRVIAGVNVNNVEEYCQCSYALSPYLNVLFRELGSDKKVRLGFDSEHIHDDDLYSLYDNFKDYKIDGSRIVENNRFFTKMDRQLVINVNDSDGIMTIQMTCDNGLHIDSITEFEIEEIKRVLQMGGFQIFKK